MAKYCSKCNLTYDDETSFCTNCGGALDKNDKEEMELKESLISEGDNKININTPQPSSVPSTVPSVKQPQSIIDNSSKIYIPPMEKFGFISMILLTFITLGFYWLYWINKFQKSVNSFVDRNVTSTGWKLILYLFITLGIYGVYLFYEDIVALNEAKDQRNMPGNRRSTVVCLILMIIGLGIIPWYWLISDANDIIDYENWKNGH